MNGNHYLWLTFQASQGILGSSGWERRLALLHGALVTNGSEKAFSFVDRIESEINLVLSEYSEEGNSYQM